MTLAIIWLALNALIAVLLGTRQRHENTRQQQSEWPRRIRNREIRIHGEQIDAHTR